MHVYTYSYKWHAFPSSHMAISILCPKGDFNSGGDHGKVPFIVFWENGLICKCLDSYLVKNGLCVWTHILGKWTCIVWYLNLYFVEINLYWVFELILC